MHQSRSRRHLEIRQESQNQFFEESNRSLGLACERVIMGHSFLSAQTHVNKMEELKRR